MLLVHSVSVQDFFMDSTGYLGSSSVAVSLFKDNMPCLKCLGSKQIKTYFFKRWIIENGMKKL